MELDWAVPCGATFHLIPRLLPHFYTPLKGTRRLWTLILKIVQSDTIWFCYQSYSTSGSVSLRSSHSVTSVSGSVSVSSSVGKRVRDTSTSKTSGGRKKHQQQSDYFVKFSNVPHLQPWLFHHTCTVLHLLCHVESALGSDTKWTLLHFGKKLENDGRPLKEWLTRRSDGLFPVVVISEDSDPRILQSATATDPDDASHCSSLKNSFDRGCRIQDVASLGAAGACEMAYPPIAMVGPTTFESVAIQPHPHPHVMMAGHTPFFHASDALGTPFATMEISASDDASAVYGEIPLTSQADMSTTTEPWAGGLEDLISDINVAAAAAGYYAVAGAGTGLGASFLETEMTILRTLWINAPHDAFTFPPEAKIEGDTVRRWHQKLLMPERRKYLGDVFGGANETMVKKLVHDRLAEDDDRSVHRAQRLLLQLCVERLAKVRAMDEGVGKAKKAFALKCMWAQYLSIQRVIDADHVMKCVADSNDDDFN